MAEVTSIAFDEILEISRKQPITKKDLDRMEELYSEIFVEEQEKYAWIMEGVMIQLTANDAL